MTTPTTSPLELAWREFLERHTGSLDARGEPYPVFTSTLQAFTEGFAAGASSQNDRVAEALEGLARALVIAAELRLRG